MALMVADPAMACVIDPELRDRIRSSFVRLTGLLVKGHSDDGPACALLLLYQAIGPFLSDEAAAALLGCTKKPIRRARRILAAGEAIRERRVGLRRAKDVTLWPRRSAGPGDVTVRVPGALVLALVDGDLDVTDLRVWALVAMDRIYQEGLATPRCAYTVGEMAEHLGKAPAAIRRSLARLEEADWLLRLPARGNRSHWVPIGAAEHTQPVTPAVAAAARARGIDPYPARKGTLCSARKGTLSHRRRRAKAQVRGGPSRARTRTRVYEVPLGELPGGTDSVEESLARLHRPGGKLDQLISKMRAHLPAPDIPVAAG
jgi:hypothetical protein